MGKSYSVGFDNVELVDGLAPDKPVWLYMRASLLNDGDPDHPLWHDEVGSLPSDPNRPGFDGFPHGDAGRYADGLIVGQQVTNRSDTNLPNFSVGPVEVGPGQTLEVLVIMLPKVWLETVSVSPETADRIGYGILGAAVGSVGGPAGIILGAVLGAFAPHDQNVDAPCFNSVIMARNVFTAADLDRIESAGIERLGPQDNEAYLVCHQPIDAYYSLSVNARGYSFAPTPTPNKQLCTLEPRAYVPAEDQFKQDWGDVGDRVNDCVQVSILPHSRKHADVTILQRTGAGYVTIGEFKNAPITRGAPRPDFIRNFFDDACPARAVKPDCPDCARFVNLPMAMLVHPALVYLGMHAGSHVGTRPIFPIKFDSDRITQPHPSRCGCTKSRAAAARVRAIEASGPAPLGDRYFVQRFDDNRVMVWPSGSIPLRDQHAGAAFGDRLVLDEDVFLPPELALSWLIVCSPEFTLATYQEIKGDGGCRGRMRYMRRNPQGVIVADVMLTRLLDVVR